MKIEQYQIHLSTQLGPRSGVLTWTEQNGLLEGELNLLGKCTPLSGETFDRKTYLFAGEIQTLVSSIPYQATCVRINTRLKGVFHTASGDFSMMGESLALEAEPL